MSFGRVCFLICLVCIVAAASLLLLHIWSVIDLSEWGYRLFWTLAVVFAASAATAFVKSMTEEEKK
jgi:hypothetical protein